MIPMGGKPITRMLPFLARVLRERKTAGRERGLEKLANRLLDCLHSKAHARKGVGAVTEGPNVL
jgi:hypothetical protein